MVNWFKLIVFRLELLFLNRFVYSGVFFVKKTKIYSSSSFCSFLGWVHIIYTDKKQLCFRPSVAHVSKSSDEEENEGVSVSRNT